MFWNYLYDSNPQYIGSNRNNNSRHIKIVVQ